MIPQKAVLQYIHKPLLQDGSLQDSSEYKSVEGGLQKCCIQTKIYRVYRKMTICGHFSI